MPPPPHGVDAPPTPRETTPIAISPRGVARYTGPPESPLHESTPSPPATNSPPGAIAGRQPLLFVQVGSVTATVASRCNVFAPVAASSVSPKPTSSTREPALNASNVHALASGRGVTPGPGVASWSTATSYVSLKLGYAIVAATATAVPPRESSIVPAMIRCGAISAQWPAVSTASGAMTVPVQLPFAPITATASGHCPGSAGDPPTI